MIKDIKKLNVMLIGKPVGTLQMDPSIGCCVFEYDKSWLAEGFSISPTELPLQSGLFYADKDLMHGSFAIFEDSLPDGYGLYLLDRMLRKQNCSLEELTPLQRLSIIGTAGMGALSYLPMMPGINAQNESEDLLRLDFLQEEALEVLSEKGSGDESYLYYNSANSGGARPKASIKDKDGAHWLVKFRHVYDPQDAGRSELLYMDTARECGIDVPRIKFLNGKYFAIERFDIAPDQSRRHVVTAAALLKTDFLRQNVDYTNLLSLTGYLTQDPAQVEEMYRRMVMNLVAVNKDDHAKNFSFICDGGKWSLAPAYDITFSPQGTNSEHATSLFFNGNPGLDLVLKAGVDIRIPKKTCLEIIEKVERICADRLPVISRLT